MTYSCAVFETPGDSLQDAQLAKIDRLCAKLELGPGDHLVEIGSGWGALALRAATAYGARVTTTTISEAQREHLEKRVADAGLSDRITVRGDDWRDLRGTLRQAGLGRDDRGGGLAVARPLPGRLCGPAGRRRAGRDPGHRHRRRQLRAGQAPSGLRSSHGLSRRLSALGGFAQRLVVPGHRPAPGRTWRTSAPTTPRPFAAGRPTSTPTPRRWPGSACPPSSSDCGRSTSPTARPPSSSTT